ncbi:MAG: Asp23/Gls24 family envelope stress response protein [Halanaerobiales bacterium]
MEVYALVGTSGTGKSYQAQIVAHKYQIPLIIDDGLLIYKGRMLAGQSAKKEKSKVSAIYRALFREEEHAEEVQEKIDEVEPDRILLLGTSLKMVEKIATRLNLPEIKEVLWINDVVPEEEIARAKRIRTEEGKHLIPVPRIDVRSQIPIVDKLKLLFKDEVDREVEKETSIVRPRFSYYGDLIIYNKVIHSLVSYQLSKMNKITKVESIKSDKGKEGLKLSVSIGLEYGTIIPVYVGNIQESIKQILESKTGIRVLDITVTVLTLYVSDCKLD